MTGPASPGHGSGDAGTLAGWAVTVARCDRGHALGSVYRAADGTLFAPGLPLGGEPREVGCTRCGLAYPVDPAALRRAARERWRYLVVHR